MEQLLSSFTPQDYLKFGELGALLAVVIWTLLFHRSIFNRVLKSQESQTLKRDEDRDKLITVIVECTAVLRTVQDTMGKSKEYSLELRGIAQQILLLVGGEEDATS